jgi:ribosome assembly protein 1
VSKPRIPFRETIVVPPKFDLVNERIKLEQQQYKLSDTSVALQSQDRRYSLSLKTKPLPLKIAVLIEENQHLIQILNQLNENLLQTTQDVRDSLKELKKKLITEFRNDENLTWCENIVDKIWSFGPNRTGPNILINNITHYQRTCIWDVLELEDLHTRPKPNRMKEDNDMIIGFEIFAQKGPLCEEQIFGVCFIVENFQIESNEDAPTDFAEKDESSDKAISFDDGEVMEENKVVRKQMGKNQIIPLMKEACKKAFESQPQRLMIAMYKVEILVNTEALGKVYAVLGKRNGKILEEIIKDGTSLFVIRALLPVAESFGFAEELRKKAGGLASPQLEFSHFETFDIDPFWEPKTEEEYLLFGYKADFENRALKYMNEIRKLKGLFTREKIVEHSEKQRTLCIK